MVRVWKNTRIRASLPLVLAILAITLQPNAWGQASSTSAEHPQAGALLRTWAVLGPIVTHADDEDPAASQFKTKAFDADLLVADGGESGLAPEPPESHDHGPWKQVESDDEAIDLGDAIGAKSWAVAYATTSISSAVASGAVLGIGSDDAVKVWLNGQLVHESWSSRPDRRDDDIVPVKLRIGDNRLLLKVMNWEGNWGFSCRLLSKQNLATQLVKAAASRDQERIKDLVAAGADVNARNDDGVTPYLAARIKGNEQVARMLVALGAKSDVEFDPAEFVTSLLASKASSGKPGIAVLVSRGDEILYRHGFGTACIEHAIPVTTDTKFRIGSVTKQFTAAAILKLQEDGKLNVQDRLNKYIPEFPRGDEVSLHHLLTHTSGLKNFTSKPDFFASAASRIEEEKMLLAFRSDGFDFDPGAKFEYCNTGYFLLSHIVAIVSAEPFDAYLKMTFFDPLGMHDTGVHQSDEIYLHEATGYSVEGDEVKKALDWDMSRAGGAGNLYSTVNDLQKWNQALFNGGVLHDDSLKMAHAVNEIPSADTVEMPYGYGWIIDEHRGLKRISHSGGLQGFVSQLTRYPEQQVTVTALHNAFPSLPEFSPGAVCDTLAEVFLWQEMKSRPKYILATDVEPETYDDYIGRYDYKSAVLTVTREDDKLMAQLSGQPKVEIFPSGGDTFFWKVVDATAEFARDSSGKVSSVRHAQGMVRFTAPRMKQRAEVKLTAQILDRFVGRYDYQGAGTLTIRRDGTQLFAQMSGQPEQPVYAESERVLFWRIVNAELRFALTEDGSIHAATHYQSGREIAVERIK